VRGHRIAFDPVVAAAAQPVRPGLVMEPWMYWLIGAAAASFLSLGVALGSAAPGRVARRRPSEGGRAWSANADVATDLVGVSRAGRLVSRVWARSGHENLGATGIPVTPAFAPLSPGSPTASTVTSQGVPECVGTCR